MRGERGAKLCGRVGTFLRDMKNETWEVAKHEGPTWGKNYDSRLSSLVKTYEALHAKNNLPLKSRGKMSSKIFLQSSASKCLKKTRLLEGKSIDRGPGKSQEKGSNCLTSELLQLLDAQHALLFGARRQRQRRRRRRRRGEGQG